MPFYSLFLILKGGGIKSMCPTCHKPLNESQYHGAYKSCPLCSQNAGIHIYYLYPDAFGKTPLRATPAHPDGPQSYCQNCRGGRVGPFANGLKCGQI